MITVLIAEDEKMIRKGLHAMVKRSVLNPDEILEARNGLEALEILKTKQIDVLITDIRMPDMDGITLSEHVKALENPPLMLVISGYDDFNYAVSMLRNGAKDYLLKPVETEKFNESMQKLKNMLDEKNKNNQNDKERFLMTLSFLMENPTSNSQTIAINEVKKEFFKGNYHIICTKDIKIKDNTNAIALKGSLGLSVYIVDDINAVVGDGIIGQSKVHIGAEQLYTAYKEALTAWKISFFTGKRETFVQISDEIQITSAENILNHTKLYHKDEVLNILNKISSNIIDLKLNPDKFGMVCRDYINELVNVCKDKECDNPIIFKDLWCFNNFDDFLTKFTNWLDMFCIQRENNDYDSQKKIKQAIEYINENFKSQINMAVVSNYVSMNYSLFSVLFKQYTGTNFVNFLQNIRIDEAKRLLLQTDYRINEISVRCGFTSEKHFLKLFKTVTGVSPSDWRKLNS